MTLAKDESLPGSAAWRFEQFSQNAGRGTVQPAMPPATMVLFEDDFSDGGFHGWRPTHMGADVPSSPVSVETDYPMAGLFLATGDQPYRAGALANSVSTWKGLSGRFPATGILSFAGLVAVQSGGSGAYAYAAWQMAMDLQNFHSTQRATPTWQVVPGGAYPARPQVQILDDSGVAHNITGLTNPVTGSTVSSTQFLVAGENEAKWDVNYVRVSYDLGNLFTADGGLTAAYYEINVNGYRFDLRSQGNGRGAFNAPQTGTSITEFDGGMNFGFSLIRNSAPGNIAPARLVAGQLRATFHSQGWLQ